MKQLDLFESTPNVKINAAKRKVGFLNRWHIRYDGKHVALAVPGEHTIHIWPGIYQDVIEYPAFDLSDAEYKKWLDDNDFVEVTP